MANCLAMKSALRRAVILLCCLPMLSIGFSQEYFVGTILYSVDASGEPQATKLFKDSQADEILVSWSDKGYEQREETGWNSGKVIYIFESETAVYCNKSEQKMLEASIQDLAKTDPKAKAFMTQLFTYELMPTGEMEIISGHETEKFEVVRSGFLKANSTANVWIAKDLKLPPSQYKFETEWKMILAPMPLQYGFEEGAVLKAEINEPSFTGEGTVTITYQVSKIAEASFPENFLDTPSEYSE